MTDRTHQPPIRKPEHMVLHRPERVVWPNGVPLSVLRAGDNEVVRIDVLMEGGRWHQHYPLQALFANRMLREGTRRYTAAQIAERLDYYGAWLDLSSGAEHAFVTLYSLNKYLPQTLDVLESLVKEPFYPQAELATVVANNVQQFKVNLQKVDFLAHRGLVSALYGDAHPCGRLAMEADYSRITPELLHDFYRRHYHAAGCSVYVSGKVTDDCLRRLEACFGKELFGSPAGRVSRPSFMPRTAPGRRLFIGRPDALQSAVRLGMVTVSRQHPDFLKLRVLVTLLGGYFGSRLMSNIREDKGYTYGISAGLASYPDSSLFVISAETANEYVEPLIAEVYREMDRLQQERVPQDELQMVKNYMAGDICRSYESAFSLSDAWIFLHTSRLPDTYFDQVQEAMESVTPDELLLLAQKYLCKENLKEVVSGKKMS